MKKVLVTSMMEEPLANGLKEVAHKNGRTVASELRLLTRKHLAENKIIKEK